MEQAFAAPGTLEPRSSPGITPAVDVQISLATGEYSKGSDAAGGLIALPPCVTPVRAKGKTYYYHQERRGKPDAGPRTALGEYGTKKFWETLSRVTGGEVAPPAPVSSGSTFKSLIKDYKESHQRWKTHSKNTKDAYNIAFARIEEKMGHLDPADVTAMDLVGFLGSFEETPVMGNSAMVMVRALMKWSIINGIRKDNPAREVEPLDTNPDGAKPFTEEAWHAITRPEAPEALRRYAVLGRATGQRISDVLPMQPTQRDEEGIQITITKLRAQPHWCPLRPEEARVIDGWNVRDSGKYITNDDGAPHTDQTFRRAWRMYQATEEGSALQGFTSHDLRATKVCDERIRGKPHQQIAAMVGMSIAMVMKYSNHIDQRLVARGTSSPGNTV